MWWVFFPSTFTGGLSFAWLLGEKPLQRLPGIKLPCHFTKGECCLPYKPPPDELHQKLSKLVSVRATNMPQACWVPAQRAVTCQTVQAALAVKPHPCMCSKVLLDHPPWMHSMKLPLGLREEIWELNFNQRCLLRYQMPLSFTQLQSAAEAWQTCPNWKVRDR